MRKEPRGYFALCVAMAMVGLFLIDQPRSQTLTQNAQAWEATDLNVPVANGAPVCRAITINTLKGVLMKVIVGGANASASTSTDFDVRVTAKAGCVEDRYSIFQFEANDSTVAYPFGLYLTPNIIFSNADSPVATETLYVRIANNSVGTAQFDIFLAGSRLD